jgi:hypothetical protein
MKRAQLTLVLNVRRWLAKIYLLCRGYREVQYANASWG